MNTKFHPLHGAAGADGGSRFRSSGGVEREATVCAIGQEHLVCTVLDMSDPTGAADHRIGLASEPPVTALVMLQQSRGFLPALSGIYQTDLVRGFDRLVYIREIEGSPAFVADDGYRRQVVDELCRRTLDTAGFVAVRPARGVWTSDPRIAPPTGPRCNEALALCHLFGSSGFAQLCDETVLDIPVPLFVQPWSRDGGLLSPQRLPTEPFSQALCVCRLEQGRMILFDRTAC